MEDVAELVAAAEGNAASAQACVTVVIPTYDRSEWLAGAIESVLAQTYADLRVVVSDNASRDATADVVARFRDPRLSYIRLGEHLELNDHFNRCLAHSETEYLFVLPDDDRMLPELLELTVPVLDAHPRVAMVHGRVRNVDDHGRVIADAHDMTGGLEELTIEPGHEFIRRSMRDSYRVHASTALIRTTALEGLRLERADFPATDFGLWLRMALSWDIAFVPRTLAVYRIHGSSYTSDAAGVTSGGYVQGIELVTALRDVKLRLLAQYGSRLTDTSRMSRDVARAFREGLLSHAAHATLPERRLVPTVRALGGCVRRDTAILLEPSAWRLLAGSVLGRRAVELIRRRRLAHAGPKEVLGG